jgi:hypothetical protein
MLRQGICTTSMCSAGRASIEEMDAVYNSLESTLQPRFQSAHDSILSTYQQYWVSVDEWIPFNPECCAIQQLGYQADSLTSQMQQASGQVSSGPGPGTQAQPTDWLSGLFGPSGKWMVLGGILLFLAWEHR